MQLSQLKDEAFIADLKRSLKHSFGGKKGNLSLEYLEHLCGMYRASTSADPNIALMENAKRSVILTIKTMMRDDISPKQIAEHYKKEGVNG